MPVAVVACSSIAARRSRGQAPARSAPAGCASEVAREPTRRVHASMQLPGTGRYPQSPARTHRAPRAPERARVPTSGSKVDPSKVGHRPAAAADATRTPPACRHAAPAPGVLRPVKNSDSVPTPTPRGAVTGITGEPPKAGASPAFHGRARAELKTWRSPPHRFVHRCECRRARRRRTSRLESHSASTCRRPGRRLHLHQRPPGRCRRGGASRRSGSSSQYPLNRAAQAAVDDRPRVTTS